MLSTGADKAAVVRFALKENKVNNTYTCVIYCIALDILSGFLLDKVTTRIMQV